MSIGLIESPHRLDFGASPVYSVEIDEQVPVPLHRHTFYEITIVMSGTGRHEADGHSIDVAPLDVFIVPVNSTHRWIYTRELSILNIYYSPAHFTFPVASVGPTSLYAMLFFASEFFESDHLRATTHFRIQKSTLSRILKEFSDAAIFKKINDSSMSKDSKDRLLSEIYFEDSQRLFNEGALLKVIASLTVDYLTSRSLTAGKRLHPTIYRMAEILDKAAMSGTAPEIAAQAAMLGISSEYLTRLFTDGIGLSPLKFFNKRRLSYAKRDILGRSASMTQIAQRFGFADAAHFSNSFREHFDMTPSKYRQNFGQLIAGSKRSHFK
jgi:AraC-like DNA-binding protein